MDNWDTLDEEVFLTKEVIHFAPGNLYWKNKQGIYLGCNHNVAKILGLNHPDDIVGKTDYDLFDKNVADIATQHDLLVYQARETLMFEEQGLDIAGNPVIYLTYKRPIIKNNKVLGLIGISMDITAEKKAVYMQIIAGTIAHDLKIPLTVIKLGIQMTQKKLPILIHGYNLALAHGLHVKPMGSSGIAGLKKIITTSDEQIDFSNKYIDMILCNVQYNKVDTSNYNTFNLIKIVSKTLDEYPYKKSESKLINWYPQEHFDFWGNDYYLKNIINNLLKNSLYYIRVAEKGEIYIWTETTSDWNMLYFKDTAKGAPQEVLKNMFDGFYSKREGGTGLGLAFCKSIMESFGGDITVESKEGEFIQFALKFPPSR